jgi:hypothetical protein
MNITKGIQKNTQRVVIYGPEGIGKTTLAAAFPSPVFIDTEGGSHHLDVARTDRPQSWSAMGQMIKSLKADNQGFKTLVIDTVDWAERLCEQHVIESAASEKIKSIEDFGYGKGFTMSSEEFGKLLNALTDMQERGWNVVLLAHAQIKKFEQPDEIGAYDRWELKMSKKCSALTKEWADALLFCNYKTLVVETENKTKKGQGGRRVIFTSHHPAWDAKNRWGVAAEIPMAFESIAEFIPAKTLRETVAEKATAEPKEQASAPKAKPAAAPKPEPTEEEVPFGPEGIHKGLAQLMEQHQVSQEEIREAVFARGYYPKETPISAYDDGFINGILVGKWEQVHSFILKLRNKSAA